MHIKVLGAAACIGHPGHTTSFLIDEDTLIDCGTGVTSLRADEMLSIRQVLLTHSHADHCGCLPLLADVHASRRGPGLTVYSQQETLDALRAHLFNGELWPDYTRQPSVEQPWLRLQAVEPGYALPIGEGLATALPANHSVPALGWLIEGIWRALAFSGDSGPCPAFWQWVSNVPSLTDVICELTYTDERQGEAARQGHMTPLLLLPFLPLLPANTHLWISHIDPGCREHLLEQLRSEYANGLRVCPLREGMLIEL
ncbi:3',5'-cyclic-nucleotide phosphodiesterase [Chromobacterium haemolyticum]|uniref:3',5'-cyclic-nucleotide phosphodiesterase n=1 Tax=Chromobacterium haemolyticum TaxID=394935 RepID=UPI000D3061A8|nr:3',5'-cyclic-nucleotide phosphodiesterase [Chromobacterium haemolyticum]PTU71524.1 3',5'-cyclic-nucleotide phosphodiesterase [Chromobacterium haemolyticum]